MNTALEPTAHSLAPIDQAALARLRAKAAAESAVDTWHPKPGDVLEGVIAGSRQATGPFGPQQQMLVRTPNGATIAVWLTKWLIGALRAQNAELGDLVSVTFHGRGTSRTGAQFNRLSVTVLHSGET